MKPKRQEVARDDRVEARAAAGHDSDAAPEPPVNLRKHKATEVDSHRPEAGRQPQKEPECPPYDERPPRDLVEDPLVQQVEELGDGDQGRHARLVHAGEKVRALQRRRKRDPGAREEQDELYHERKRVMQGKNGQQIVLGIDQPKLHDTIRVGQEVSVRQHDTLGGAGGAGRIENRGQGVALDDGEGRSHEIRVRQDSLEGQGSLAIREGIQVQDPGQRRAVTCHGQEARGVLPGRDGHAALGMPQHIGHLRVTQLDIQWNRRPARRHHAEVGHGPLRSVLAQERHAITGSQTLPDKRCAQEPSLARHVSEGEPSVPRRLLDLES